MGVPEASESRVVEICMVNPGKDGFFDPSISWQKLQCMFMEGGRPALDDFLIQLDWLRTRANQCYVDRPDEPAPGPRKGE